MARHDDHEHCGLEADPEGVWVRYSDALLYGSEQFGLGRQDGQADAEATRKPFTPEAIREALRKAAPGANELGKTLRDEHFRGLNRTMNLILD